MTALFTILVLLAQAPPTSIDQIRTDPNPEHRARVAIDFAAGAERNAESDYSKADMPAVATDLKTMQAAIEIADQALRETGKSAMRHPGPINMVSSGPRKCWCAWAISTTAWSPTSDPCSKARVTKFRKSTMPGSTAS